MQESRSPCTNWPSSNPENPGFRWPQTWVSGPEKRPVTRGFEFGENQVSNPNVERFLKLITPIPIPSPNQWLKCKIRGGGMLHSGLGPDNGRVPLPSIITIWGGGTLWAILEVRKQRSLESHYTLTTGPNLDTKPSSASCNVYRQWSRESGVWADVQGTKSVSRGDDAPARQQQVLQHTAASRQQLSDKVIKSAFHSFIRFTRAVQLAERVIMDIDEWLHCNPPSNYVNTHVHVQTAFVVHGLPFSTFTHIRVRKAPSVQISDFLNFT